MNGNTHFKSFGFVHEVFWVGTKLQIVSVNVGDGSPNAGITVFVLLVSSELVLVILIPIIATSSQSFED